MESNRNRSRDGLALVFAMSFPSLMSWIEFWILPGDTSGEGPDLHSVFALGKIVQFAFPLVYVFLVARSELKLTRPHLRGMGLAIGFGVIVMLGTFALYFLVLKNSGLFDGTAEQLAGWLAQFHANTPEFFLVMALFISVIHSLLEEYYWRWFVFGRLQRYLPLGLALVISGLAFMAHHVFVLGYYFPGRFWIATVPFSLCVAAGGVVWGWMYHRYQNLYATWLSHLLADVAFMVVGYDMVAKYW